MTETERYLTKLLKKQSELLQRQQNEFASQLEELASVSEELKTRFDSMMDMTKESHRLYEETQDHNRRIDEHLLDVNDRLAKLKI